MRQIEDGSTELCQYDFRYRKDARSQKRLDEVASMNLEREDERLGIIDDLKVRAEQNGLGNRIDGSWQREGITEVGRNACSPGSSLPLAAARFFAVRKRQ